MFRTDIALSTTSLLMGLSGKLGGSKRALASYKLLQVHSYSEDAIIEGTIPKMGKGVKVGQYAEVTRIFTKSQVDTFGSVIQDNNFLHTEIDWEDDFEKLQKAIPVTRAHLDAGLIRPSLQTSDATKNIASTTTPLVHGMLVSSIFSSIFAGLVPGCIYVNQTLSFVNPVFVNELVIGRVQISKIRPWRKGGVLVQCDTQVLGTNSTVDEKQQQQQRQLIKGEANVWLPEGY